MGLATSAILVALAGWVAYEWYAFKLVRDKLAGIPTIGSDTFILSYFSAWKFVFYGRQMIQEGYDKYHGGIFKVPTFETESRWLVVASGEKFISEIKEAPKEVLSNHEFTKDFFEVHHTFGKDANAEEYGVTSIQNGLTRGLTSRFAEMVDEIERAFEDCIPASREWTPVPLLKSIPPIVCRTSNRLFVGKPLCHDPEYLRIQQTLATQVAVSGMIVHLFPSFLRSLVGRLISYFPVTLERTKEIIKAPLQIEERLRKEVELGKRWVGRPNDLVSWLLDYCPPHLQELHDLALRIIVINFAAIHTTSMTLSNALFELAARPEYIEPLRQEVEEVIEKYGWNKEAMNKMRKLDSFIKETGRVTGLTSMTMARKVMQDFTLSNGTVLPAGASICAATAPMHNDPSVYDGAANFDGFRFCKARDGDDAEEVGSSQIKDQMAMPNSKYLLFGMGKQACPGRFFAVNEIKCMIAHILVKYDIKLPEEGIPPPRWIGTQRVPSSGSVLFRKQRN